jgi:hypothetical protein
MIMKERNGTLVARAFVLAVFILTVALMAELGFVYGMRLFAHSVSFTSFFAVCFFPGLSGFAPTLPSPSRLSFRPVGLWGRILLLIEFTIFVAVAIFASSQLMVYKHVAVPVDLTFAAYAYVLVLVVTLVANFGRLRREIAAS